MTRQSPPVGAGAVERRRCAQSLRARLQLREARHGDGCDPARRLRAHARRGHRVRERSFWRDPELRACDFGQLFSTESPRGALKTGAADLREQKWIPNQTKPAHPWANPGPGIALVLF